MYVHISEAFLNFKPLPAISGLCFFKQVCGPETYIGYEFVAKILK